MKTVLWATLTANGNYARSHVQPPKQEVLADFADHVKRAGNFIVGRRTFESFAAGGPNSPNNPFAASDIVVVSTQALPIAGVTQVPNPHAALAHLEFKGHKTALIAGGEQLHNAFLSAGLVDELVLNIVPLLEDKGLNILLKEGDYQEVQLLEQKRIGGDIIQLRYAVRR